MTTAKLFAGKRALIVDDEKPIRLVLDRILSQGGLDVVEAPGGMDALIKLSNERFDVIFMDLHMPAFSGEESIKAIKDMSPDAQIIVYSGYDDPGLRVRLEGLGVAAIIKKPSTNYEILQTVKQVLMKAANDSGLADSSEHES